MIIIIYNYPPKGEVNSVGYIPRRECCSFNGHNFFFVNFCKTMCHFSLRSHNSKYPRIFQVTGTQATLVGCKGKCDSIWAWVKRIEPPSSDTTGNVLFGFTLFHFQWEDLNLYLKIMQVRFARRVNINYYELIGNSKKTNSLTIFPTSSFLLNLFLNNSRLPFEWFNPMFLTAASKSTNIQYTNGTKSKYTETKTDIVI